MEKKDDYQLSIMRLFIICPIVSAVLSFTPQSSAAEEFMLDGIEYVIDSGTKTAEVKKSHHNEEKLVYIPASITVETAITQIYRVTSIAEGAFQSHQMEELYLPDGLETIGNQAFVGCTALMEVNVPNSVTAIGELAFAHCPMLKSMVLGDGVKTIGSGAFQETGLEHVYVCASQIPETYPDNSGTLDGANWAETTLHVPASLMEDYKNSDLPYWSYVSDNNIVALPDQRYVEVASGAFKYTLDEITMTAEVTGYGDDAEKNLIIPSIIEAAGKTYHVTSIGEYALSANDNIVSLAVSEGVRIIGSGAFSHCHSLLEAFLPNSVAIVGNWAFDRCSYLCFLSIGKGVKSIGHDAFVETGSLEDFYIYAPQVPSTFPSMDDNPNNVLSSPVVVHVPATLVEEYQKSDLPNWSSVNDKDFVAMPEGDLEEVLCGICRYRINRSEGTAELMRVMDDVTDPSIPASIEVDGQSYLITRIGSNAFMYLDNKRDHSITLPETLITIGREAFANCRIPVIHIPNSVADIEEYAFCERVQRYGPRQIFNMVFKPVLKEIHIGEGVKKIADMALIGSENLRDIYIHAEEVPQAGPFSLFPESSLDYCDQLMLHVPESLLETYRNSEELPWSAFKNENIVAISSTAINGIYSGSSSVETCYSLDGRRLTRPLKGISIIRRSDGTTKKVIVKR